MLLQISVCILALNEEAYIGNAIESILPYVNEVLVLDTGSSDQTREISETAGARVNEMQWTEDFSEARNRLLESASSPFILMMDADEVYVGDGSDLAAYVTLGTSAAGRIKIVNELDDGEQTETYITRIFPKNSGYRYKGIIHEQLTSNDQPVNGVATEIVLIHYGYQKKWIELKQKTSRNLNLLLRQLDEKAEDPYLLFQIGKTLYVAKDYEQASHYFQRALGLLDKEGNEYKYTPNLWLHFAYSLLKEKKWSELEDILAKAIENYPYYTDLYYIYASWIIEAKRVEYFHKIPWLYSKCLEIGEADPLKYETSTGVGSYKALYNLGLYYEITGKTQEAKELYIQSGKMNYTPAQKRLAMLNR
ncbi:glycosyltransferase [Paenibacillus sp. NPDC093718]|uniref:glycosyltransferase n=1 Tax=Paenibacillus sp. NPDC093718 TaxID=3390601 RepID=UPI003D035AC2